MNPMRSAATAMVAAGLTVGSAVPGFAGTLVVLNKAEATASLIDSTTEKVVATLPTGTGPHEVAVSRDGKLALVANYGSQSTPGSTLTLIDVPAAAVVKTIDLGSHRRPHGIQWLADGRRAVVTSETSQALLVVDVEAAKVASEIPTGEQISHMVVVSPDGARAYVANIGSGSIAAIDLAAGKKIASIPTGAGAEGIDISPDGGFVWVTNRAADTVSVVDATKLAVVETIPSKSFPIRVKVTPDGRTALVTNARSGEVALFDTATRKELRRLPIKADSVTTEGRLFGDQFGDSPAPVGVLVRSDAPRAYVALANADAIVVLDLEKWRIAGTLHAGKEPDGLGYSKLDARPRPDAQPAK